MSRTVAIYIRHQVLEDMPCKGACALILNNNDPSVICYEAKHANSDLQSPYSCYKKAMGGLGGFQLDDDWCIYKIYVDACSGNKSLKMRKALSEMLQDADNGKFDLIIVRSMTVLARNVLDTIKILNYLNEVNVEVYFTEEGIWSMHEGG